MNITSLLNPAPNVPSDDQSHAVATSPDADPDIGSPDSDLAIDDDDEGEGEDVDEDEERELDIRSPDPASSFAIQPAGVGSTSGEGRRLGEVTLVSGKASLNHETGKWECVSCRQSFAIRTRATKHWDNVHKETSCPDCGFRGPRKDVRHHKRSQHKVRT